MTVEKNDLTKNLYKYLIKTLRGVFMDLTITDLNVELSSENVSRIKQKARRMFNSVCDSVQVMKIVLNDINGPKGGKDKHCRVIIHAKGMPDIVVTDNQTSVMSATNMALARAKSTLLRKVKRKQKNLPRVKPFEVVTDIEEP